MTLFDDPPVGKTVSRIWFKPTGIRNTSIAPPFRFINIYTYRVRGSGPGFGPGFGYRSGVRVSVRGSGIGPGFGSGFRLSALGSRPRLSALGSRVRTKIRLSGPGLGSGSLVSSLVRGLHSVAFCCASSIVAVWIFAHRPNNFLDNSNGTPP